jgi:hypothetical protein
MGHVVIVKGPDERREESMYKLETGRTESIQGVASDRTNRSLVAFSSFAERTDSTLYVSQNLNRSSVATRVRNGWMKRRQLSVKI